MSDQSKQRQEDWLRQNTVNFADNYRATYAEHGRGFYFVEWGAWTWCT